MTGKTHVACGTVTMLAMCAGAPEGLTLGSYTYTLWLGLATVAAGSLLPDIDIQQSSLGSKHKLISKHLTHRGITHTLLVPILLCFIMAFTTSFTLPKGVPVSTVVCAGIALLVVALALTCGGARNVKSAVKRLSKIQGFAKALLVVAVLLILAPVVLSRQILVLPDLLLGLLVGWVVHIIADAFNKKGVPILWPLTSKKFHIATVLTGSWQEAVFLVFWIGVNVACLFFLSR